MNDVVNVRAVDALSAGQLRLRVALVTETYPPEVNGVAMTLGRMVGGLLRRGHSVQLIRPRQNPGERPAIEQRFQEVLVSGLPIPKYDGLRFGLPSGSRLTRLWQQQRPDIVHVATEGPLGWSAVAAARKLRLPISSGFHTNFHHYSSHYGLGWLRKPIGAYLRGLHNRTNVTLVPTQTLAGELRGSGFRNLAVVSRGVDIDLFHSGHRSAALRAGWGAMDDELVVLCVGRLAPEKNIPLVLAAFAAIRQLRPDAKLLFVGDGPMRSSLSASCPEAILAGMRSGDDLAAHYASADLFLFPSMTETFGNVTTEALASGLGVVAFDYAAAADLIADGINGRAVAFGDEAAFVTAAAACAAMDPVQLSRLRANAAASVAHLNWELIHDRFDSVLSGAVAAHAFAAAR